MIAIDDLLSSDAPRSSAEFDRLATDLVSKHHADDVRSALLHEFAHGRHLATAHELLVRLGDDVSDAGLVELLGSADAAVAWHAAATLADRPDAPRPAALVPLLRDALLAHRNPPATSRDALSVLRHAERLARNAELDDDSARRVQQILFYLPKVPYSEAQWPAAWARAAQLLDAGERADLLYEVAESDDPHYLGAAGAIALARRGIMTDGVRDWLRSNRDYFLLDDMERVHLRRALAELGDADDELAYLAEMDG